MNVQNQGDFSKSAGIIRAQNNGAAIITRTITASFTNFTSSNYAISANSSPDFSYAGTGRLTYNGSQTKTFFVKTSLCFDCANTSTTGFIAIAKNASVINSTQQPQRFSSSSAQFLISYSLISLAKNDFISIFLRIGAINQSCTFYSASIEAESVGS